MGRTDGGGEDEMILDILSLKVPNYYTSSQCRVGI